MIKDYEKLKILSKKSMNCFAIMSGLLLPRSRHGIQEQNDF